MFSKRFSQYAFLILLMLVGLHSVPTSTSAQPVFKSAATLPTNGWFAINGDGIIQFGSYFDPVDFDNNGIPDITNRGGSDIFVASYDLAGNLNWIQTAGGTEPHHIGHFGPVRNEYASATAIDEEGYVYVAGTFDTAADFDYDGINDVSSTLPDTLGNFLAIYDHNGVLQYTTSLGAFRGQIYKLFYAAPRQSLYLVAHKLGTTADGLTPTYTLTIMELDLAGNVLWEKQTQIVNETNDRYFFLTDATLSSAGHLFMTGRFRGNIDFDHDGPVLPINSPNVFFSTYITKYDAEGELQWST